MEKERKQDSRDYIVRTSCLLAIASKTSVGVRSGLSFWAYARHLPPCVASFLVPSFFILFARDDNSRSRRVVYCQIGEDCSSQQKLEQTFLFPTYLF